MSWRRFRHANASFQDWIHFVSYLMERSVAGPNELIGVAVAARNDSTTNVNKLTIQLQQEIVWTAKGHPAKQETNLASVVVPPGSDLGGFQWIKGSAIDYYSQNAGNSQSDLQQQLAGGGGTRFELVVPGTSAPTLQVENVKITHSVGVGRRRWVQDCSLEGHPWHRRRSCRIRLRIQHSSPLDPTARLDHTTTRQRMGLRRSCRTQTSTRQPTASRRWEGLLLRVCSTQPSSPFHTLRWRWTSMDTPSP